jgi:hypothetical protein
MPPPHLNFGHATYFPSNYQGFLPNQSYSVVYPLNNFSTAGFNFYNQPYLQNQNQAFLQNQVKYNYQTPQFGFMSPWQNCMMQYQRNSVSFETISQVNPVMIQNHSQFDLIVNNPSNEQIRYEKGEAFKFHENGFGEREKMMQHQGDQVNQFSVYQNWRR